MTVVRRKLLFSSDDEKSPRLLGELQNREGFFLILAFFAEHIDVVYGEISFGDGRDMLLDDFFSHLSRISTRWHGVCTKIRTKQAFCVNFGFPRATSAAGFRSKFTRRNLSRFLWIFIG